MRKHGAWFWAVALLSPIGLVAGLSMPVSPTGGQCEDIGDGFQNDAGSGRDAGDDLASATPIRKHEQYYGNMFPIDLLGLYRDEADVFMFQQPPGEYILANVTGYLLPSMEVFLVSPSGQFFNVPRISFNPIGLPLEALQDFELEIQTPEVGRWLLAIQISPEPTFPPSCPFGAALFGMQGTSNYAMDVDGCRPKCFA